MMSLGLLLIRFLPWTLPLPHFFRTLKKKGKIIACILPLLLLLAVSKVESSGGFRLAVATLLVAVGGLVYPGPIRTRRYTTDSGSALSGQCLTPLRGPVSSSQPPTKPDSHDVQCYPAKEYHLFDLPFFFFFFFWFLFFPPFSCFSPCFFSRKKVIISIVSPVPAKKSYHQNKRIVLNTVFHHRRWFIHWYELSRKKIKIKTNYTSPFIGDLEGNSERAGRNSTPSDAASRPRNCLSLTRYPSLLFQTFLEYAAVGFPPSISPSKQQEIKTNHLNSTPIRIQETKAVHK